MIIIGRMFICIISMFILFMYDDFLFNAAILSLSFDLTAAILSFCQARTSFVILRHFTWSTILRRMPELSKFKTIPNPATANIDAMTPFTIGSSVPSGPSRIPKKSICRKIASIKFKIKLNSI